MKEIVKDHARLQSNLRLLQRLYSVAELASLLGISTNTWRARLAEPWRLFSYDDFRQISRYCKVDFSQLVDGTLEIH